MNVYQPEIRVWNMFAYDFPNFRASTISGVEAMADSLTQEEETVKHIWFLFPELSV